MTKRVKGNIPGAGWTKGNWWSSGQICWHILCHMRALEKVERQMEFLYLYLHIVYTSFDIHKFCSVHRPNYKPLSQPELQSKKIKFSQMYVFWISKDATRLTETVFSTLPSRIKCVCEKDICFQRKIILVMKLFLVYSTLQKVLVYVFSGRSEKLCFFKSLFSHCPISKIVIVLIWSQEDFSKAFYQYQDHHCHEIRSWYSKPYLNFSLRHQPHSGTSFLLETCLPHVNCMSSLRQKPLTHLCPITSKFLLSSREWCISL